MSKTTNKLLLGALIAGTLSLLVPAAAEAGWRDRGHYYQPNNCYRPVVVQPCKRTNYHAWRAFQRERALQARIRHQQRIAYQHYLRRIYDPPVYAARRCR